MTVMRYAILVTLMVAALSALISASADSGQSLLVHTGQGGADARALTFWVLGGIALITSLSLCRFVLFGIPSMFGSWYQTNRQWLGIILLGVLIWGVFYLI